MYLFEWWTVSVLTRELFLYLFPELRSNQGNKHKNNTRVSAETVRHESSYIILFLTQHNESINDDLHTSFPCFTLTLFLLLMTSQSIADVLTIITWIMISNSLDIHFIQGNVHSRLCKKIHYIIWYESDRCKIQIKIWITKDTPYSHRQSMECLFEKEIIRYILYQWFKISFVIPNKMKLNINLLHYQF